MNTVFKNALVAAAVIAASTSARAAYHNGDLLLGFTKGSGSDYIFDLGLYSSLTDGQQWNLSSDLNTTFVNLSSLSFGVIGALNSSSTIFSTTDGSFAPANNSGFTTVRADVATIGQNSTFNTSVTIATTANNSWYNQTDLSGAPAGITFQNDLDNPNVTTPSLFTDGGVVAYLYASDDFGNEGAASGRFTLDTSGTVTFNAVPEPTAFSLIAGLGLLTASLHRKFKRNA